MFRPIIGLALSAIHNGNYTLASTYLDMLMLKNRENIHDRLNTETLRKKINGQRPISIHRRLDTFMRLINE